MTRAQSITACRLLRVFVFFMSGCSLFCSSKLTKRIGCGLAGEQSFLLAGRFILGPDTNILILTLVMISIPSVVFNVFVAPTLSKEVSPVRFPWPELKRARFLKESSSYLAFYPDYCGGWLIWWKNICIVINGYAQSNTKSRIWLIWVVCHFLQLWYFEWHSWRYVINAVLLGGHCLCRWSLFLVLYGLCGA